MAVEDKKKIQQTREGGGGGSYVAVSHKNRSANKGIEKSKKRNEKKHIS